MDKNELCKKIKNDINNLNQNEIEEIFKIIYKNNNIYTKTNAGVNINLSLLDIDILNQINNYIDFCIKSHSEINKYEIICNNYSDVINKDNKNDENANDLNFNNITDKVIITKQKISSYMKFYLLKKKFLKQMPVNHRNDKPLNHEEYLIYE